METIPEYMKHRAFWAKAARVVATAALAFAIALSAQITSYRTYHTLVTPGWYFVGLVLRPLGLNSLWTVLLAPIVVDFTIAFAVLWGLSSLFAAWRRRAGAIG